MATVPPIEVKVEFTAHNITAGDSVLITTKDAMTDEQAVAIGERLRSMFPGVTFALMAEADFLVLRGDS